MATTTYTAGERIEAGDVVCITGTPLVVKRATPSNLAAAGSVLGIALCRAAEAGTCVQVADSGAVANEVTQLGAPPPGAGRIVIVSSDARCAWLIEQKHKKEEKATLGQDFAVGIGDPAGNVTIQPHSGVGTGGTRVLNVRLFGARFDGKTDDAPAIEAAIRALDPSRGGIVLCPFGRARLAQTVDIDRPVVLQGAGGSLNGPGTEFVVDKGVTGFKVHSVLEHPASAAWSTIRDVFIRAAGRDVTHTTGTITKDSHDLTVANPSIFQVGQIIRVAGAGQPQTMVRAKATIMAGADTITVNSPGALLWPENLNVGDSGQRLDIKIIKDNKEFNVLPAGTRALTQSPIRDPETNKIIGLTYTLSGAATEDATDRSITFYEDLYAEIQSISGNVLTLDAYAASGVTDAPVTHADAAIVLYDRARLFDVQVRFFQGPGILIAGSTGNEPKSNANTFGLTGCRATDCLHGVYAVGKDSNAGYGINLDVMQNRLFGLVDASFLGNTWMACHVSGSRGYKTVGFHNRSTFLGCYTEDGTQNLFDHGALVVGGTMSADVAPASALVVGKGGTMGTTRFGDATDRKFSDYAVTFLPVGTRTKVVKTAVSAMRFDADREVFPGAVSHDFRRPIEGDGVGATGWWALQSGRRREGWAWLWSDGDAPEGLGQLWFPHGMFVGTQADGALNSSDKRRINYASLKPKAGGKAGDFMFNRSPREIGNDGSKYVIVGWSCVLIDPADPTKVKWVECRCLTGN